MEVTRDRPSRTIYLSQAKLVEDVLTCFNMTNCKPAATPLDPGIQLSKAMAPKNEEEVEYMKRVPYLSAVGSLMYLGQGTCPDISTAVGTLCQFSSNPGPLHWKALQHVLHYLKGTINWRLALGGSTPDHLVTGYSDSDFAGNIDS